MGGWRPTSERQTDRVSETAARALHDLLDIGTPVPNAGDPLPLLWHWLAFLPRARQSGLGSDGHPEASGFLPPIGSRARMYGGGEVSREGVVRVGEDLERESVVSNVVEKGGRSGALTFITVNHRLVATKGSIRERSDIVYRQKMFDAPMVRARASEKESDPGWDVGRTLRIDPPLLFRFSALTYNAHRIHYDRDYATNIEGYPGLVVHGPLQAIALADAVRRAFPEAGVSSFAFRSIAPAFDDADLELRLRRADAATIELGAFSSGWQTMMATAKIETTG